jgi:glycosyltransferase involved in cell wall biosynthesis
LLSLWQKRLRGGNISTLTIVVITRDHNAFIKECLTSIKSEFDLKTPIFIVDVGSIDGTILILEDFKHVSERDCQILRIDRTKTPLGALRALTDFIYTDFVAVISGDDFFLPGYGAAVLTLVENNPPNFVANFSQLIVDENSIQIGRREPKWSSNAKADRRKLLYSNPGTTAGCLLPWVVVKEVLLKESHFDTMIEDYFISTKLIHKLPFKSELQDLVAYRVHENNLTKQRMSKKYAKSIGICISLSWNSAESVFEKLISLSLIARWGRHVHFSRIPQLLAGIVDRNL